ncbi:MAG: metallophosphoesterase, partial [Nanoarchaeota archaeon]
VIENKGIIFLRNESISLDNNFKNGEIINIIGVDTPDVGHVDLEKALKNINLKKGFNLLLSHTYDVLDSINNDMNIDLILAGDTHGGQIKLPFIGKYIFKNIFKFDYVNGKYQVDNIILYINRGLGTVKFPFRFRSRPELTIIDINNLKN